MCGALVVGTRVQANLVGGAAFAGAYTSGDSSEGSFIEESDTSVPVVFQLIDLYHREEFGGNYVCFKTGPHSGWALSYDEDEDPSLYYYTVAANGSHAYTLDGGYLVFKAIEGSEHDHGSTVLFDDYDKATDYVEHNGDFVLMDADNLTTYVQQHHWFGTTDEVLPTCERCHEFEVFVHACRFCESCLNIVPDEPDHPCEWCGDPCDGHYHCCTECADDWSADQSSAHSAQQ